MEIKSEVKIGLMLMFHYPNRFTYVPDDPVWDGHTIALLCALTHTIFTRKTGCTRPPPAPAAICSGFRKLLKDLPN